MSDQKWDSKLSKTYEKYSKQIEEKLNFEQEKTYFMNNKDMLKNKIVALQEELVEERELETLLEKKDVTNEEEIKQIKAFLDGNNDEIDGLFQYVCKLSEELKEVVKKNKEKQKELEENSQEYKELINSHKAKRLAQQIKHMRSTVVDLDDFLVKEGVKGGREP